MIAHTPKLAGFHSLGHIILVEVVLDYILDADLLLEFLSFVEFEAEALEIKVEIIEVDRQLVQIPAGVHGQLVMDMGVCATLCVGEPVEVDDRNLREAHLEGCSEPPMPLDNLAFALGIRPHAYGVIEPIQANAALHLVYLLRRVHLGIVLVLR